MKKIQGTENGQSLIEVLVGLTVGAIIISGVLALIIVNLKSSLNVRISQSAFVLSQELMDMVKSVASSDWHKIYNLSKGSSANYYIATSTLSAVSGSEPAIVDGRNFTRYFYVENSYRLLCGTGGVTSNATTSCALGPGSTGVTEDPSTQKITAVIKDSNDTTIVSQYQYITRSLNYSFNQTDWSGGGGQEGPIIKPNNLFYSATNADSTSTPGAIKIQLPEF